MCVWPATEVLYSRLPGIRHFAHQKLSEVAWSNNRSSPATHLWSSAQCCAGPAVVVQFFVFFLPPDSSAKWGDWIRKQETHESPRIISLCLGGLLFSLLPVKIDKRKGKAIRSECLVALADCNPLPARYPHGLFVSTYFGLVILAESCREAPLLIFVRSAWNTANVAVGCTRSALPRVLRHKNKEIWNWLLFCSYCRFMLFSGTTSWFFFFN